MKLKAIERNVSFDKNKTRYAFVLTPELYGKLTADKVIKEASLRSGLPKGVVNASWNALSDVIVAWATEGHSVAIPGLGTMRFGVRGNAVEKVDLVSTAHAASSSPQVWRSRRNSPTPPSALLATTATER